MALRTAIRRISHGRAFSAFVSMLDRAGSGSPHLLRVLTYHRVGDPDARRDLYPNILSATPEQFAQQMEYLVARYHVIGMPELLASLDGNRPLPRRSVLITFDDGYTDFAEIAWPVMRRHGLAATLFVATAYPDNPELSFWWDRVHQAVNAVQGKTASIASPIGPLPVQTSDECVASVRRLTQYVKSLPHHEAMHAVDELCESLDARPAGNEVLGWDELRRLAAEGVTLGAHTRTHPLMNRMSLDEAHDEAVGSLFDIATKVGGPPILAYPAGGSTNEVARMLEKAGFRLAFTTQRGINDMRTADRLLLKRINVGRGTSAALLGAQMLPVMKYASRWLP
jgi:peptidoglycan/xylan/chitin deacetylase (PgdA/CDA1 family)